MSRALQTVKLPRAIVSVIVSGMYSTGNDVQLREPKPEAVSCRALVWPVCVAVQQMVFLRSFVVGFYSLFVL